MRILIQRVSRAEVRVSGVVTGKIGSGLVALVGFSAGDGPDELNWLGSKLAQLRVFPDSGGKMNCSVEDTGGCILVVSQFTLYGDATKGNRPNFMRAAPPETAERLYNEFVLALRSRLGVDRIETGVFQAMMEVELVNDGPVTLMLEKENATTKA